MIVTLTIFVLGIITVVLSIVVAAAFYVTSGHRSRKLTLALTWQLIGEAVIGLGTLIFATAAHFGWLDHWSEATQSSIRLVMFLATSLTTVHLFRTVHKISHG